MKYIALYVLVIGNLSRCMETAPSTKQIMYNRLNTIFTKLQQPIDKDFNGSGYEYRASLFKQVETLLSNSETAGYQLPINAQTKCHGETLLCRAAEHDLPFLSTNLAYSAEKLNLAKAFWIAALQGKAEAVDAMLIFDPMLTWQDSGHIGTALHNAAYSGHKQIAQKIIDHCFANAQKKGLNVKAVLAARDMGGKTPFDYASEKKDYEMMELIGKAEYRCNNPAN